MITSREKRINYTYAPQMHNSGVKDLEQREEDTRVFHLLKIQKYPSEAFPLHIRWPKKEKDRVRMAISDDPNIPIQT